MNTTKKNILFTGGTSGLGVEAVIALAKDGHEVAVIARDLLKLNTLRKEFKRRTGQNADMIRGLKGDLSNLSSVVQAIEHYRSTHDRLDVLVNNAGLWNSEFRESRDGMEETLQVNLLAPYILLTELKPLLLQSEDARVITTASGLHQGTMRFEDVEYRTDFSGFKAYRQSKHGVILMTRFLAQHEDDEISYFSHHPGFVATELGRDFNWFANQFFHLFGISPKKGAKNILLLANSPLEELQNGAYYHKEKVKRTSRETYDMRTAGQLMDLLNNLKGQHYPVTKGTVA